MDNSREDKLDGVVTQWIVRLKQGDEDAAAEIWNRFRKQILGYAKSRLARVSARQRFSDEDDLANSVFFCLLKGIDEGRFNQLSSSEDLWKLIVKITCNKAVDVVRKENADRRGGGSVRGESVFSAEGNGLDGAPGSFGEIPSPHALEQTFQELLQELPDDVLRQIAKLQLQGYTQEEIATELEISVSSIQRKLGLIRKKWRTSLS